MFIIDQQFEKWLPATERVTDEELEAGILRDGILDDFKVAVFQEDGEEMHVLMDGHRRYRVCERLNQLIPLDKIVEIEFGDRAAALAWMDGFQFNRRNLTEKQMKVVRARLFTYRHEVLKESVGDAESAVAEQTGVCIRTIARDREYAADLEKIVPEVREQAERELNPAEVKEMASLDPEQQIEVTKLAESGEFTSLKTALMGAPDPPPEKPTKKKKSKPSGKSDIMSERDAALKAIAGANNAISKLHDRSKDKRRWAVVVECIKKLGAVVNSWDGSNQDDD